VDFIKIKNLGSTGRTLLNTGWQRILAACLSDRKLVSRISKGFYNSIIKDKRPP